MVISLPQYDITIKGRLLDEVGAMTRHVAPAHRYAIITDSNVDPLYSHHVASQFPGDSAHTFVIPAGESHKNRDTWASLTDQLLNSGLGRDSAIVALGGGVVGDMAGFVAATFMRGIPFVQVPTTLLAMIDASIGGKTGVDTPAGKNLVGAFHHPSAVLIDPVTLQTLDLAHRRAGLAEAVKHSIIADEAYFLFLNEAATRFLRPPIAQRDPEFTIRLIEWSVRIKADVVARDEREQGVRKILNFGHTIGHAIELLSDFMLAHGDAVAIGMVLESEAAERAGVAEPGTTKRIATMLHHLGLPVTRPLGPSADQILGVMRGDKKSRAGAIEYAVPTRIGQMASADTGYGVRIDDAIVREVLTRSSISRNTIAAHPHTQQVVG